jgi:flagellar assembly protein FliH
LSKVIKSFSDPSGPQKAEKDIVIGIQPIENFKLHNSFEEEDDESKILRLKNEATKLLEDAQNDAARIVAEAEIQKQAQNERLALEEQEWRIKIQHEAELAQKNGYESGYESGLAQGLDSWHTKLDEVKSFIDKTKQDYYEVLKEAEPQMVVLAVKAAEKIIGERLNETPETWVSMIKKLVKEVRESQEIKLYVPIDWFELTLSYREELKNLLQANANLFIYPDETLKENGAVIEFPFGKIDACLDVQLREIREKLLEQIEVTES